MLIFFKHSSIVIPVLNIVNSSSSFIYPFSTSVDLVRNAELIVFVVDGFFFGLISIDFNLGSRISGLVANSLSYP